MKNKKDQFGRYSPEHLEKIITMWRKMCSKSFFFEHPEFDDVLIEINVPQKQKIERGWLASRVTGEEKNPSKSV